MRWGVFGGIMRIIGDWGSWRLALLARFFDATSRRVTRRVTRVFGGCHAMSQNGSQACHTRVTCDVTCDMGCDSARHWGCDGVRWGAMGCDGVRWVMPKSHGGFVTSLSSHPLHTFMHHNIMVVSPEAQVKTEGIIHMSTPYFNPFTPECCIG